MSPPRRPPPRPDLAGLRPYSTSDAIDGRVLLYANENPYPLPASVMEEILASAADLKLNRYPEPDAAALTRELAAYNDVDPSWVWVGDGSNEVLLQTCLAYGGAGRRLLLFEPTYRMHYRQARAAGTAVEVTRRRPDFTIDPDDALASIGRLQPDVVVLCTPNNPTGTLIPPADVQRIADAAPGLVVVDEAYYEFSGVTFAGELDRYPNVIVVRTLSKAFRLAGVRLGYAIAQPETLEPLACVRMPYGLSSFAQVAASIAVRRRIEVLDKVPELVRERERLSARLSALPGVEPFPSGANFVLFRLPSATKIAAGLAELGIVVRDFSGLEGCENCLRVTAGTPAENDEFLDALSELL